MKRVVATMLTVLIVNGFTACEEGETHPSAPRVPGPEQGGPRGEQPRTPNPQEGDPQPHQTVVVRAGEVEAQFLPAEVDIYASPVGFHHFDIMTSSNAQKWSFEVPEGITVTVSVNLKPSRTGSKSGWCSIESGRLKDGPRIINGGWQANCNLVIPA